ncbi:DUF1679 domain-containing protein [Candidatus Dependentiae bacterium]|nr:DUF1679 domain-containing protein [Candidatus Dependentiae bacterium]
MAENNQWDAEYTVDIDQAKFLIENQFPTLAPTSITRLGEGWDNVVYLVNHTYTFRFPRRQMGADLLKVELAGLPVLSKKLTTPVPKPLFLGNPTADYQWPFLGYHFLEGKSACAMRLNIDDRIKLAPTLAHFLKNLHATTESEALALGLDYDRLGKLDVPFRVPKAQNNIAKIRELGLFADCDALQIILDNLVNLDKAGPKCLVHGDLYARHLLINRNQELSGIIDWGDLHIGNPAVDLQILFSFLPRKAYQSFIDVYGPIDKQTQQLALFRALCHTSVLLLYAHDINDKDLLDESLFGLQLMIEWI